MRRVFLSELLTPAVEAAQEAAYGRVRRPSARSGEPWPLGPDECRFIAARDSFYLASVSASGWPYLQHRGGPPGFLHVVHERQLAFADYPGNRQLLSVGNVAGERRVVLFLMDYAAQERLKIIGHARVVSLDAEPALAAHLRAPAGVIPERLFVIEVVGFDWNCSKYITPRYPADEVEAAMQPLRDRIAALEAELARRG